MGGCVCACALAVRGEVAGWPARCPGEQVVRSGRIWPWWLDVGLAGACMVYNLSGRKIVVCV